MQRRERNKEDDGVSEILGVIMMLAMVVSIMGGVFVFLNPYLVAFQDNTNWNSANNIADRIEDRLDAWEMLQMEQELAKPSHYKLLQSIQYNLWKNGFLQRI